MCNLINKLTVKTKKTQTRPTDTQKKRKPKNTRRKIKPTKRITKNRMRSKQLKTYFEDAKTI